MTRTDTTKSAGYKAVELSTGEQLKVYPVPQTLVWGARPSRPKPEVPVHAMKTATGEQRRTAKPGDSSWEPYEHELKAWEEEKDRIQEDLTLVFALGPDYVWPKNLDPPKHFEVAINAGILDWPKSDKDPIRARAQWIRAVVAPSGQDLAAIQHALMELSGVPREMVEEIKERFRSDLLGSLRASLETITTEHDVALDGAVE